MWGLAVSTATLQHAVPVQEQGVSPTVLSVATAE